jgi:hypothetical protein
MFFEGYIGAPPTVTVFSSYMAAKLGDAAMAPIARAAAATVESAVMRAKVMSSSRLNVAPLVGVDGSYGRMRSVDAPLTDS